MITVWHQEARDVALILTRKLGEPVTYVVSKQNLKDHEAWLNSEIKDFCRDKKLSFELDVPNAASRLVVEADFLRRTVRAYMTLSAPSDRKSNAAKLNWVLRQLGKSDLSTITVTCITRGKAHNFGAMAHEIDPASDEIKDLGDISSFQIEMSSDLSRSFNSRKKFVEALEIHVPKFYSNVGEHLRAFVAPPPKLTKPARESEESTAAAAADDGKSKPAEEDSKAIEPPVSSRPDWASSWQLNSILSVSPDDQEETRTIQ